MWVLLINLDGAHSDSGASPPDVSHRLCCGFFVFLFLCGVGFRRCSTIPSMLHASFLCAPHCCRDLFEQLRKRNSFAEEAVVSVDAHVFV